MGLVLIDEGFQMAPSIMLRLLGPVTTFVDRPWKVMHVMALVTLVFTIKSLDVSCAEFSSLRLCLVLSLLIPLIRLACSLALDSILRPLLHY
jgi:hypothetical protein